MTYVVLVTGIGGNIGQGVLKSLRASRYAFTIIGLDQEPLSAGFYMADAYECVPRTGTPGFEEKLKSIARNKKPKAIYVCSPTELPYFSLHRARLEKELNTKIFVNPASVCAIGEDKFKTAEFLEKKGFPFPLTTLANGSQTNIDRLIQNRGFPLVMKPLKGYTSRNVFLVKNRSEIEAVRRLVPEMVVQEYLPDTEGEFTAGTVSGPDGKVRGCIILRRELNQGTTYRTELYQNPRIEKEIKKMAETFGAVGPCNFQFRLVQGRPVVFEINPRFSGTSGVRYLYGFNDVEILFKIFCLKKTFRPPRLRPAVVLRYWNEVHIPGASFEDLRKLKKKYNGKQTTLSSSQSWIGEA